MAMEKCFVGLDVGGTKVEALVVDERGTVCEQFKQPVDSRSAETSAESVAGALMRAVQGAAGRGQTVAAVGVGVPGQVQDDTVKLAVNLNLDHFPLGTFLAERAGAPVVLENDVRVAAVGAFEYIRRQRPVHSLGYLSIGTGIAAGFILDDKLYRGANRLAGELGHVSMDPNGPRCRCGVRGCLEALAAGPAIARQAQEALLAGRETCLKNAAPLDARAVYQAAGNGDALAKEIIQTSSSYLAQALQWIVMGYDVEVVALGGGVSHEGDLFLKPVMDRVAALREGSAIANEMLPDRKFMLMPADYNAGVWGALKLAQERGKQSFVG